MLRSRFAASASLLPLTRSNVSMCYAAQICSMRWNSGGAGGTTNESSAPSTPPAEEPPKKRRVRFHQKGIAEKRSAFQEGSSSFLAGFSSIALVSLGCAFLFVPLYRLYCSPQGKGADPKFITSRAKREQEEEETAGLGAHRRKLLRVRFLSDVGQGMPIKFVPLQREMEVLVGEPALAFFSALNTTDRTLVGTSTYTISPAEVMLYLNKIQCFCFEEQRFKPHELVEMPVFFYLDRSIMDDPMVFGAIDEVILSYTFFNLQSTREIIESGGRSLSK
jgi:cytochrome c oxidase assembly protein subunit 11